MSKDKDRGFTGLLIGLFYLVIMLALENTGLYLYHFGPNDVVTGIYQKLIKMGFMHIGIMGRFMIILLLLGGILMYRPIKKEGLDKGKVMMTYIIFGLLFLCSGSFRPATENMFILRNIFTFVAFCGTMRYSVRMFQVMDYVNKSKTDPFNDEEESFLQTEEKMDTPHSVNIPYRYRYKKQKRKGWINLVNLFRALLLVGTPGSGKSFAIIVEIMQQLIEKRFTMVVYSYKQEDLVQKAYGYLQHAIGKDTNPDIGRKFPKFYRINFDDPRYSNLSNPIKPYGMKVQSDAIDNASTLMKNLNKDWIKKTDYFSRSAISFTGACIWYLKKKSEEYEMDLCTLGHLSILTTVKIDYAMEIMMADNEVRQILVPFKDALDREAMEQLSGQTSTVQISLSALASKEIMYIMSGDEFDLQANNPNSPKIIALQNNHERRMVYSAPLGLYMNSILKTINKPDRYPLALIVDELPTLFIMSLRTIIDTGRENMIATVLGIQSVAQLILEYGKELADVIYDNCANFICGSAKGESAKRLSELFGKIHQRNISKNTSSNDVSTNDSTQMRELLPKSKIAAMSTGTFAGLTADTFENRISQKKFYGELIPDFEVKKEIKKYRLKKIRSFKDDGHDQKKAVIISRGKTLGIVRIIRVLFQDECLTHRNFYSSHLDTVLRKNGIDLLKGQEIKDWIKEQKLYDYIEKFEVLLKREPLQDATIQRLLDWIVDENLELGNMNKVLDASFEQILKDIDTLVKQEYKNLTGDTLEKVIFDEKKINDEIAKVISKEEENAEAFMSAFNNDMETLMDEGLSIMAEEATKQQIMERDIDSDSELSGSITVMEDDIADGYSSFPVQNLEE